MATTRPEAAYTRIARIISERIVNGEYQPGQQLPSERKLAKEFGVSLMTLRRATQLLAEQGLVSAEHGRGTFVRSLDLGEAVFNLRQWREQWAQGRAQVKVLEVSSRPAGEKVGRTLRCSPETRTLFLRRLILDGAEPITYQVEYVAFDPRRPLMEAHLSITSPEGILQSAAGSTISACWLKIQAHTLAPEEAGLLRETEGKAALSLEHIMADSGGTPISWGYFLCRADRFWLETALGNCEKSEERGRFGSG